MATDDRWFFDRVARVYDLAAPRAPSGPIAAGLSLADGPVRRVLDVGGGTGRAARGAAPPEWIVVDTSRGMLRRAPPGLGRVHASATALPVADGVVDAVVIVDALHHMPDHGRVFAESRRVLRPGGVLVVREFDRATVRGRLLAFAERALRLRSTFRTAAALRDALVAAGFEATVLDEGFSCTVAGRKPGRP